MVRDPIPFSQQFTISQLPLARLEPRDLVSVLALCNLTPISGSVRRTAAQNLTGYILSPVRLLSSIYVLFVALLSPFVHSLLHLSCFFCRWATLLGHFILSSTTHEATSAAVSHAFTP